MFLAPKKKSKNTRQPSAPSLKIQNKMSEQKTPVVTKKRVTRTTLSKKSPSMGRILEESGEEKNSPSKKSVSTTKSSGSEEAPVKYVTKKPNIFLIFLF